MPQPPTWLRKKPRLRFPTKKSGFQYRYGYRYITTCNTYSSASSDTR